jgi:hypothetical protein
MRGDVDATAEYMVFIAEYAAELGGQTIPATRPGREE